MLAHPETATFASVSPSVSVIIPALNAARTIGVQLAALERQDFEGPWEVVVVDNGSTDDTVRLCESGGFALALRVVVCQRPGTGAARNFGVASTPADLLLFCDADDEVDPGWVREMTAALATDDAVGGRIENERLNGERPDYMPRHPDRLPVVAGFLPRAIAASLGVRRAAFEQIGGFREDYTYGSGDTEFCWRLQLAGFSLAYASEAVVHYRHRSELGAVAVKAYKTQQNGGRLYRDYRAQGMRSPSMAGAAVRWARLLASIPVVPFSRRVRWWWVEQTAGAVGRVSGSVRHRVVYL